MINAAPPPPVDPPPKPSPADISTTGTSAAENLAAIDRSLVRGVAWMGLMKWSGQIIAWGSTIVVARLLTPADYGLVGMATLYLGLLTILSEFGIGTAIVMLRTLTKHQIEQINTVSVIFGVLGFLISCTLATSISRFFNAPELPLILVAMSSTFLIASFRSVPWALLQRDMRFQRVAVFEGIQSVVLAIVAMTLAALGFRYWTLVIATILSSLISTGLALALHRVAFARPQWTELRRALSFSREVIIQRLAWYVYSDADFLIAARVLGTAAYGAYSVGWTLANTPIDKISTLVLQVTPSIFSAVQDDRPALARYVLGLAEAISIVIFPLLIGIAVVAPEFVPLVLGSQWVSMIVPLQILALYACFRAILPMLTQILLVTGQERFSTRNTLLAAVVLPIAFYIGGTHLGLTGIALAWIVGHPLIGYRLCRVALAELNLTVSDFLMRPLWPAVSSCVVMAAVVLTTRVSLPSHWPAIPRLVCEIVAGVIAYPATLLLVHRKRIDVMRKFASTVRASA